MVTYIKIHLQKDDYQYAFYKCTFTFFAAAFLYAAIVFEQAFSFIDSILLIRLACLKGMLLRMTFMLAQTR